MKDEWKSELGALFASIKGPEEATELLTEILTPAEYEEIVKRWQIVKLLNEGKTFRKVSSETKTAIATVIRGAREIKYGHGALKKFYQRLYRKKA